MKVSMKAKQTMKQQAAGLAVAALALLNGTAQAGTYAWNTTDGMWDTTTENRSGAGTTWVDGVGNGALFNNTATAWITVSGARTAGSILVGDGGNNAGHTFASYQPGDALTVSSFIVQGNPGNGSSAGVATPTVLQDLTLTCTGNLGVGRWQMVIAGTSTVNAGGQIGGSISGISADWGRLIIQDSAVVRATNGVYSGAEAWGFNLNGATLYTPFIQCSDHEAGGERQLNFDGGTVVATRSTNNFISLGNNYGATYSAFFGDSGLIFDTAGYNIGISVNLKGTGGLTKLGAGTLSLSGTNSTYPGPTTINAGTLAGVVGGSSASTDVSVAATPGATAVLGVTITNKTNQWTCASVTVNNGGVSSDLQFDFGALTLSTTNAPLNVLGSVAFLTAPTITILGTSLPLTTGDGYPLMTWGWCRSRFDRGDLDHALSTYRS